MDFSTTDVLFYLLSMAGVISALAVVFVTNPVYSALFLAIVMSVLGVLFFMLGAPFVAASQIIVYAGAVMVLFVMVMMLFDLKKEAEEAARISPMTVIKIMCCGILCGVLTGVGWLVNHDGFGAIKIFDQTHQPVQQVMLKNSGTAPTNSMTNPEDLKNEVAEITQNQQVARDLFKDYTETQKLSIKLFSKFVFAFEALSILLLVAVVGAVALARSKGGTHHVISRS